MKKALFICIAGFFLTSCYRHEVRIEEYIRLGVNGKLLNRSENAVPDISVISAGSEHLEPYINSKAILGTGKSLNTGIFSFVSLNSSNSFFSVNINHPDTELYNEHYSSLSFIDSLSSQEIDMDLGEIFLEPVVNFTIETDNISGRNDTLFLKLKYEKTHKFFKLDTFEEFRSSRFLANTSEANFRKFPDEEEINTNIETTGGSQIVLEYKFAEDEDWNEWLIPVNITNSSYEFEY
ncbi:hypothetical protein [Autumnicola musiva]|uniref:Uncharacterized protein n=1 Tax=Autumnicola musiva TaxID=3075589 RepID=A0ABU3D1C0_9FLAO|nr:hypothetical protein [Zunongwangia sp. F117]MDT0675329.1 hypothetical protein [Zunongwangia sp. F117]